MKTLLIILCVVFFIGWVEAQPGSSGELTAKATEVLSDRFQVNTIELREKDNKISLQITLTNKGEFFSYPVVQVKNGDKIIANKEGIFFLYGMFETEQFIFETDAKPEEGAELTILIGSSNLSQPHIVKYKYSSKPK
jgi:hypothetical protein